MGGGGVFPPPQKTPQPPKKKQKIEKKKKTIFPSFKALVYRFNVIYLTRSNQISSYKIRVEIPNK